MSSCARTLWQVLSSVDLECELCSSQSQARRPEQVPLDILLFLCHLLLLRLKDGARANQHIVRNHRAALNELIQKVKSFI